MKTIRGDLVLKENFYLEDDLTVEGNIRCEGRYWDLKVNGNIDCKNIDCKNIDCKNIDCKNIDCLNIDCWNIDCKNIDCKNIDCKNIDCWNIDCKNIDCLNIDCKNIDCLNIDCGDINCGDLNFYAFAIAYKSFKCKSWKARRDNYVIKCLDGKIEIKDDKKYCDKCRAEIKGEKKE
jgi:hypothetical protein